MVTYEKVWDGNETEKEDTFGRVRTGVVGWVYAVHVNGEYEESYKLLREVKRKYPDAVRRKSDN